MFLDLHRHLEGSHSARALAAVARRLDIRREPFFNVTTGRFLDQAELAPLLGMRGPSDNAQDFYDCIERARRAYGSVEAVTQLAHEAFVDAAAECDGLEMRVSLFSMTRTLLGPEWTATPPDEFARTASALLMGVLDARDRAQARVGKVLLVRLGFSRTFVPAQEAQHRAMVEVIRGQAHRVCGLDILGILPDAVDKEPLQPLLVDMVRSLRDVLPDLTIHAGEFNDHRSVERALDLQVRGVGHGVHAVASDQVLGRLRDAGVTVEVCPSSNALLIPSALARLRAQHGGAHPLRVMQQHGVWTVLGSDDPVPMNTSFGQERAVAAREGVDLVRLEADMDRRWAQLCGA